MNHEIPSLEEWFFFMVYFNQMPNFIFCSKYNGAFFFRKRMYYKWKYGTLLPKPGVVYHTRNTRSYKNILDLFINTAR